MVNQQELEAKTASSKKNGFNTWMNNPMTKALISTIPAGENREALVALLQASFEAGHEAGSGMMLIEVITTVMSKPRNM